MASKQSTNNRVVKLTYVVSPKSENGELELCLYVRKELGQYCDSFRFVFEWESPCIVSIVIKHCQVELITRNAYNWRCPYIKSQNLKKKHAQSNYGATERVNTFLLCFHRASLH